jgi:glycosyltransferase involved in cell wall biosynthesis
MHILFLTDNFPPEVNAPASRTFEHCREWVKAGHRVTVVTCAPNFPTGRVFDGYANRAWSWETVEGIRVLRVWTYVTANEGFAKRIADYASFMVSAVLASPFVRDVDIVVGTSPQLFTACAARAVGTLKRVPWVFELRDLWPDSIGAVGAVRRPALLGLLRRLEESLYRSATAIVSVTHAFRGTLMARGFDGTKIHVVTNGADLKRYAPRDRDASLVARHGLEGRFVAGYIGTHGMAHALDTVLDAAARMKAAPGGDAYRFVMLGDGANKAALVARARSEGLDNIVFVDSVPKDEVVRWWSVLDASIIHLKRTPLFTTVIPSKLFECMAMGIPVLHGVEGESADIVEREDVGLPFEPQNAEALCAALVRLATDDALRARLRGNGPRAARDYDRTELAASMLAVLERTARQPGRLGLERPNTEGSRAPGR